MQFRGYSYALRPTPEQETLFNEFAGVCRLVWNLALEQRRFHSARYRDRTGEFLGFAAQSRQLKSLRAEFDFIRDVPFSPADRTLRALDAAYRNARAGRSGFPQPKKKGTHDAFSFQGRDVGVRSINRRWGAVRIPKIGWVKYRATRPIMGSIREVSIVRTAIGWQVNFGCMLDQAVNDNGETVGIDRGVTIPIMLSDGESYALPAHLHSSNARARRAQRRAGLRSRGSKRHIKAMRRARRLKAKVARIRKDWAHRTTTEIARRYGGVVVEALNTKGMTAKAAGKRSLNRAILNVGWHQIETMLAYKAARFTKVNPAYSSQTCSACGAVDRQSRKSQASFVCTACGHRDNADRNAAIVILHRGSTPGVEVAGYGAVEARTCQAA